MYTLKHNGKIEKFRYKYNAIMEKRRLEKQGFKVKLKFKLK